MKSLLDTWLVARFEVLRAVRTWRALALVVLYMVSTMGSAYLFIQLVGAAEQSLAVSLGVPVTDTPGAMMDQLIATDSFRQMLAAMVGGDAAFALLRGWPILAIYHLWFSFLLVPFFAGSASAECIAIDLRTHAIRYEALRTGRAELVLGRFGGQLFLTGMAAGLSVFGVWTVGMLAMVGHGPVELMVALGWFTIRAWTFSIPFVGVGVACSQLTASAAWARVLAIGSIAGSWVATGLARWAGEYGGGWAVVADVSLQILPQGWLRGLWAPGLEWLGSAVACGALGVAALVVGYSRFAGRDL